MPEPLKMPDFIFENSCAEFINTWCTRNSPHLCDTGTMYLTYLAWLSYNKVYATLQPPSQLRFTRYVGNNVDLNPAGYRRRAGGLYYANLAPKRLLVPCSPESPTLPDPDLLPT